MYVPLRAILLDHMYIYLHGSLYPMMDYMSRVYDGPLSPCLLMLHGVRHNAFTSTVGSKTLAMFESCGLIVMQRFTAWKYRLAQVY